METTLHVHFISSSSSSTRTTTKNLSVVYVSSLRLSSIAFYTLS